MSKFLKLKVKFAVSSKYEAFYTGGKVEFSKDGEHVFCCCGNQVKILEVSTGKVFQTIGQDDDEEVTCFSASPDGENLVVAHRHLVLKQWDWKQNVSVKSWKAIHTTPISSMAFDDTSTLLATGGSDSSIKIFDIIKQYCTHNLRGHTGVVNIVAFKPRDPTVLISGAEDYKIRVWDLMTSTCQAVLDKHYSVITSFSFTPGGDTMLSSGRDSVVIVWDMKTQEHKKTIPVFESVESINVISKGTCFPSVTAKEDLCFLTAGSKGIVQLWSATSGKCLHSQEDSIVSQATDPESQDDQDMRITHAMRVPSLDALAVVTFDHNIILYNIEELTLKKQFVGYNDEVLDVKFLGEHESHLVVATNSPLIKIFNRETWGCQIIQGHTDIVLSIDVFKKGNFFASCSKDNTIRLWKFSSETESVSCIAVGRGHTHAVGSVALPKLNLQYIVSGSEDCTLKLWPISSDLSEDEITALSTTVTEKAHEKDINSIAVAPNDKIIATGSQDKTAKLWNAANLSLLGVLRGHRRGIWCVQFSPVDQCVATSSADGNIKIWALSDYTCVKTFEGHDASILKVTFITRGMQLLSSGSDGLVKLWTIKNNECVKTFDEHSDKVWALTSSATEDVIVTAAADSNILIWRDVTQEEIDETTAAQNDIILKEQELLNLLQQKKYLKAIGLAITLEQPFRLLNIIKDILQEPNGNADLEKTIKKLRDDQMDAVLRFCVKWNTNSKHCHEAQTVLTIILKHRTPEELMKFPNMKSTIEGLVPYTERHMKRLSKLLQQSTFVDYTWQTMKLSSSIDESSSYEYTPNIIQGPVATTPSVPTQEVREDSDSDVPIIQDSDDSGVPEEVTECQPQEESEFTEPHVNIKPHSEPEPHSENEQKTESHKKSAKKKKKKKKDVMSTPTSHPPEITVKSTSALLAKSDNVKANKRKMKRRKSTS